MKLPESDRTALKRLIGHGHQMSQALSNTASPSYPDELRETVAKMNCGEWQELLKECHKTLGKLNFNKENWKGRK